MYSTISIFPSSKKNLEHIKVPFRIFVEPLKADLPVYNKEIINKFRCSECHSYFNGFCKYNDENWICSVCNHCQPLSDVDISLFEEISSNTSFCFWEDGEIYDVTHAIIIGDGYGLEPAQSIIQSLPPSSKIEIYVFTTQEVVRKIVTTSNVILTASKEVEKSVHVPINRTLPILQTLLNGRKDCVWARVFCGGGTLDERAKSRLSQLNRGPLRTDFYLDSKLSNHHEFASSIPGVLRVYSNAQDSNSKPTEIPNEIEAKSIEKREKSEKFRKIEKKETTEKSIEFERFETFERNNIASKLNQFEIKSRTFMYETVASDCARTFAFQCKTTLRMGNKFRGDPIERNSTTAVVASEKKALEFIIQPLHQELSSSTFLELFSENSNLSNETILSKTQINIPNKRQKIFNSNQKVFQCVQAVSHCYKWDPPTNKVKKFASVITNDFEVSNNIQTVLSSISPSVTFEAICRENLNLNIDWKTASLSIRPLEGLLNKRKKDHFNEFQAEFSELCEPTSWRFVLETFVETWTEKPKKKKSSQVLEDENNQNKEVIAIIIKKFPNVEFGGKEGSGVESILRNAARKFVELCRPLDVDVKQLPFEEIKQHVMNC